MAGGLSRNFLCTARRFSFGVYVIGFWGAADHHATLPSEFLVLSVAGKFRNSCHFPCIQVLYSWATSPDSSSLGETALPRPDKPGCVWGLPGPAGKRSRALELATSQRAQQPIASLLPNREEARQWKGREEHGKNGSWEERRVLSVWFPLRHSPKVCLESSLRTRTEERAIKE